MFKYNYNKPSFYLEINWQGKLIIGNNKQILLEQLEKAGIYIEYSCRVGICGCCNIKLINGKVIALNKSAIIDDNTILCCSCVPKTKLFLGVAN